MQRLARYELGDRHAVAGSQRSPTRHARRFHLTHDVHHPGQMAVPHAARRVEQREAPGISGSQHHAAPRVDLHADPALDRLAVLQ